MKRRQFGIVLFLLCALEVPRRKFTLRNEGRFNETRLNKYLKALLETGHIKHPKDSKEFVITAKGKTFRKHLNEFVDAIGDSALP